MNFNLKIILSMLIGFGSVMCVNAQDETDIFNMSLEELMNMEITSVSKKAERLQDVASSIYVMKSEDIIKTGATTLHEVLRTIPGYWGVQSEYSEVSSSIRNSPTENGSRGTVLYLLDGTPIQDLMASSFSFRNFDIPIDEIDRIEVIRGSGGTIYGANSATGVINIFTKDPTKYDGINVKIEGATPGYTSGSVRAGSMLNDKVSISGYGKFRLFNGFESQAGIDENGNKKATDSRFTKNYDKSTMFSMGFKTAYNINEKSKLSLKTHFNTLQKIDYSNYYEGEFAFSGQDVLIENDVNASRFVGNLQYDLSINENHDIFARFSTNYENDFHKPGGGYNVSNSILDFEIQDNISIGQFNDLSIGANYRSVNFNVHNINSINAINYVDPKASESITAAFVQDKFKLMEGKLNFLLGVKAENYSLVNNNYYLSPMAKISFIPNENLTLWGGFTQAFTTPGFNNTNVDFYLFQTPSLEAWNVAATQGVYQEVYNQAYQSAIDAGADEATASNIAGIEATDFLSTTFGQQTVNFVAITLQQENPNVAVKNGSETTPTKFRTWEIGFRTNFKNLISMESNFFYSNITEGISVGPDATRKVSAESITQPGRLATYYLYGNYVRGSSIGNESMVRILPIQGIVFEVAHTYLKTEWELQKNDDFDVNSNNLNKDQTPSVPEIPEHIFKVKGSFDLPMNFNISANLIHGSKFGTQAEYRFDLERYENLVIGEPSTTIAKNNSRTIVSFRVDKKILDNKLTLYCFGNDIFNKGIIAASNNINNVTISQIGSMFGLGLNYKLN